MKIEEGCDVSWLLAVEFRLTPALSLGERVNLSLCGEQSRHLAISLRDARCSLSPRERVRVRGNGANDPLAYWTSPWTVEPGESSGRLLKRL